MPNDTTNRVNKPGELKVGTYYRMHEEDGTSKLILVISTPQHRNGNKRQTSLAFDFVEIDRPQKKVQNILCQDAGLVPYDDQSMSKRYLVTCPALMPAETALLRQYKK
jgi:hypothetical protein